jgi:hypothetical protein
MPKPRIQRWTDASYAFVKADPWLVLVLQGSGRLDVDLFNEMTITAANIDAQITAPNTVSEQQIEQFNRHLYQSFLWVLAAYEFVRTLDQICRADSAIYGDALSKDVNHFKHQIERLRIPLAKLERVRDPKVRKSPKVRQIAYPVWVPHKGVAWQLDPSTIIARVDLSEELLSLVEKLKASTPST